MAKRAHLAQNSGIAHQDIKLAITLIKTGTQTVNGGVVGQVHGNQSGGAAQSLNFIIGFFKTPCCLGNQDTVCSGFCKFEGAGSANTA